MSSYIDPQGMDFQDCYPMLAAMKSRWPIKIRKLEQAQKRYRAFADRHVRPIAVEVDRKSRQDHDYLDWEFAKQAAKEGLFSVMLPKMFGGQGGDLLELGVMLEELCAACTGLGNILGAHYLGYAALASGMDVRVIGEISDDIITGEKKGAPVILCAAHTEPQAGSDVEDEEHMPKARVGMTAKKVEGGYVLNGQKIFISNGHFATWHVVTAYRDKKDPLYSGIGAVVRTGQKGFHVVSHEHKMGQGACPASFLSFEDCFVSDEYVLIAGRDFFERVQYLFGASRVGVAAIGTGCARGAYEKAIEIAKTENINGKFLIDEQWAQQILADMLSNVMIGRAMYMTAALNEEMNGMLSLIINPLLNFYQAFTPKALFLWGPYKKILRSKAMSKIMNFLMNRIELPRRQRSQGISCMAKYLSTDIAMKNANLAMDIAGAAGLSQSSGIEKVLRDAKLLQIYEGTNQINRKHLFDTLIARKTTM